MEFFFIQITEARRAHTACRSENNDIFFCAAVHRVYLIKKRKKNTEFPVFRINIYMDDEIFEDDEINAAARRFFRIGYVYPYQRLVIHNVLCGCGHFGEEAQQDVVRRQISASCSPESLSNGRC